MFLQIEHSAFQGVLKHHCGYSSWEVLLCNCPFRFAEMTLIWGPLG